MDAIEFPLAERILKRVSSILYGVFSPPNSRSAIVRSATCLHHPAEPSNGRCGPAMPARASSTALIAARAAAPEDAAFHIDRLSLRTCLRMLAETADIAMQCASSPCASPYS